MAPGATPLKVARRRPREANVVIVHSSHAEHGGGRGRERAGGAVGDVLGVAGGVVLQCGFRKPVHSVGKAMGSLPWWQGCAVLVGVWHVDACDALPPVS